MCIETESPVEDLVEDAKFPSTKTHFNDISCSYSLYSLKPVSGK